MTAELSHDLARERYRRAAPPAAPAYRPRPGSAAFCGKVATGAAPGHFLTVNPVTVLGAETAGGSPAYAVDTTVTVAAFVAGSGTPAAGQYVVVRRAGHRWVTQAKSAPVTRAFTLSVGVCDPHTTTTSIDAAFTDHATGATIGTYHPTNGVTLSGTLTLPSNPTNVDLTVTFHGTESDHTTAPVRTYNAHQVIPVTTNWGSVSGGGSGFAFSYQFNRHQVQWKPTISMPGTDLNGAIAPGSFTVTDPGGNLFVSGSSGSDGAGGFLYYEFCCVPGTYTYSGTTTGFTSGSGTVYTGTSYSGSFTASSTLASPNNACVHQDVTIAV